ncbi:MAG: hypothetical protein IJO29_09700 [Oscillospiraceae bacterium]|nr:hypothetical protein [Oscillospiraceae bacterium]
MKRVSRMMLFGVVFLIFSLFLCVNAYAFTDDGSIENDILEISGADKIDTSYVQEYLDEYSIAIDDADSIRNISIKTVLSAVINIFIEKVQMPLRLLAISVGVIFITAALKECEADSSLNCRSIAVLVCAAGLCPYFAECIETTCTAVCEGADFLSGFVPVFSAITLFSGSPGVSGVYSSAMLSFCAVATSIATHILMPVLSCILALSIVNAATPVLRLAALIGAVKKLMTGALLLIMVIFVGLLSLQTLVASSTDSLSMRTSKYIVSSSIPIVGSAVGEAYSSVVAGIGVIRSSTGAFGVICVAFISLPVLISAFAMYTAVKSAGFVAEIFGVDELKSLFNDISSVLSIALAVLVCFFLMALICTAMVMTMVKG